jgi:hypothetical protein
MGGNFFRNFFKKKMSLVFRVQGKRILLQFASNNGLNAHTWQNCNNCPLRSNDYIKARLACFGEHSYIFSWFRVLQKVLRT